MGPSTASPPAQSKLRGYLYLAALSVVFLQAGLYASRRANVAPAPWLAPAVPAAVKQYEAVHPITQLMADAETAYRQKLARQSKTLKEVVAEYRKRYGRAPPKGFDKWWAFAQANGVRLVDEYDNISEDLKPFWEISSQELKERVDEVRALRRSRCRG